MSIPKAMQSKYDEIADIIKKYSKEHLNQEYEDLCLHALGKLARKRPSPLLGGRPKTWAAGIVYAIGANNFIFDKSQPIHMTGQELATGFGLACSTASNKAAEIKRMLKINRTSAEWTLPSMLISNPLLWYVDIGGMVADARHLPLGLQIACHQQGLIPFVPALENSDDTVQTD